MEFEWHQIKNEHSCDTEKNSERAKMIFDSLLEGIITEPKKIGFKELIRRRINNMSRKTGRSMIYSFIEPEERDDIAILKIKHISTSDAFFFLVKNMKNKVRFEFIGNFKEKEEVFNFAKIVSSKELLFSYAYIDDLSTLHLGTVTDIIKLE